MEVVATRTWLVHWGGCNNGGGGMEGQVTRCRLPDGLEFYTRENLHPTGKGFHISSGQRMALKRGEKAGGVNVLELCCHWSRWDEVADLVAKLDPKKRPVMPNRKFTANWAAKLFAKETTRV